jgi:hypothetical protein
MTESISNLGLCLRNIPTVKNPSDGVTKDKLLSFIEIVSLPKHDNLLIFNIHHISKTGSFL